jgi:membrane-associated protease RseP (regulator of RpoE activity)
MLKQGLLTILFLYASLTTTAWAQAPTLCRTGFTYEISRSPNWGKGKPIITAIHPYSPAQTAGLKVYDVIESIDGIPVTDITPEDLPSLLNPAEKNEITLTITNIETSNKQITIAKECKRTDAITEDQLASAFAMYSLESTSERLFTCPFHTTTTSDSIDFAFFQTYAFTPVDADNQKLEEAINATIEKELRKKGLTFNAADPDMIIQTFYYYKKNPNYTGENKVTTPKPSVYRYDLTLGRMQRFPFLSATAAEAEAQYLLQLGFRFVDQRFTRGRVIWECEANEMLDSPFRLENYAQTHVPLMCMQYPYARYTRNVQYQINRKAYNYTGISYDVNRLELALAIDPGSPAQAAGLIAHDVIERIDNHPLNHTADEFTAAYKQFITNTMKYRDPKTLFTDANGFAYCMYWNKLNYPQVADILQNPRSMAPFAYLYKFAPYVNPSGLNACTFYIKRGKEKVELTVRPTLHEEVMIEIK